VDARRLCARGNQLLRFAPLTQRLPPFPHWRPHVRLREFFADDAIKLELASTAKDDVLKELVGLLHLDERSEQTLVKMLKRRETLGSTGIGQNIAIPHCRALAVNSLRVAFGRKLEGIDFNAIDGKAVHYFFLIVAPPLEVSNQYLPVLGKIAQFAKEADVPDKLAKITTPQEFLKLLEDKNI
jgi:mannitol/fructose-specific phosphotransferase system IIA component (Ntr-type)